jgi:D-amino-acid dehydrogenase
MKVVVIGGGILGASAAYHLAREGADVTLVDRADEGRATAAGAGIVCPWGAQVDERPYYALLAGGARYYPELMAMLGDDGEQDLGYARVGGLYVPEGEDELEATETRLRARAADAPEAGQVERLAPADARSLFPPLRPGQPGVFVSGGARVDGRLMAAALQRAATRRGAKSIQGSAELVRRGSRVAGARVDGEILEADCVVVAAGAWAPALLAPIGIRLAVEPQRGQIIHLRLPGTDTSRWPVLMPLSSYYLLAFDDARVVIGATREFKSGFDYSVTASGVAEVLAAGLAVAPGLATWTLQEIRIGFRPLAADNWPMLGSVPGMEGLLVGNGLGPSGLTMGPYAGALLAKAALGHRTEIALADYAPLRQGA